MVADVATQIALRWWRRFRIGTHRYFGPRGRPKQVARRSGLDDDRRILRQQESAGHEVPRGNPYPVHVIVTVAIALLDGGRASPVLSRCAFVVALSPHEHLAH